MARGEFWSTLLEFLPTYTNVLSLDNVNWLWEGYWLVFPSEMWMRYFLNRFSTLSFRRSDLLRIRSFGECHAPLLMITQEGPRSCLAPSGHYMSQCWYISMETYFGTSPKSIKAPFHHFSDLRNSLTLESVYAVFYWANAEQNQHIQSILLTKSDIIGI